MIQMNFVIESKLIVNNEFKRKNDDSYFRFIHSLTLLNHCLETKKYDFLHHVFDKLISKLFNNGDETEKRNRFSFIKF